MLINTDDLATKKASFRRRILLPSVLCGLVVLLSFFQFWMLLQSTLNETSSMFLAELNMQRMNKIEGTVKNNFLFLDSLESTINRYDKIADALHELEEHVAYPSLRDASIITPDGLAYNVDGTVTNNSTCDFFQAGMRGEKTLRTSASSAVPGLIFSVPIVRDNTIMGVLSLTFSPAILFEKLQSDSFEGRGVLYILDCDGNILFQSGDREKILGNNYFDNIQNTIPQVLASDTQAFRNDMRDRNDGHLIYTRGTERHHLDYRKLNVNDWYLLSSVPGRAIDAQPFFIARMTFLLCGIVAASILLLMWFIFHVARKGARAVARAREELALLVDNIPGGVICCLNDAQFTKKAHSTGFLELTGYTDEELETLFDGKYQNMIYEDDRQEVQASVDEQLKSGNTIELLYRLRCKSGKVLRILEKGQLVFPEHGESMFYSVLVDISGQFEARQQLEDSKQELENLTANIPGGVIRCRRRGDFLLEYVSEGYLELIGYTRDELMNMKGKRLARLIHPQDLERVLQESEYQFSCGTVFETEYRLIRKDGRVIWVYYKARLAKNKDGDEVIDGVFIDITDRKATLENLYISEERYRLLSELTDAIVYEYDIKNDSVYVSPRWEERFGYPFGQSEVVFKLQGSDVVFEEDKQALYGMLEKLMTGTQNAECEYRVKVITGEYIWCRNIATVVKDKDGTLVKILGKIFDIDTAKKEQEELTERAQRDTLTGLYNKGATKALISDYLAGEGKNEVSALMVIDVDNFKSINDNLGHMFGDTVLSSISSDIQHLFRSSDVVGRIGGDEFMVFLKKMPLESFVVKSANAICEALHNTFTGDTQSYSISCSIGIAMYPKDGISFNELFKGADCALYKSKEKGKNQFSFYNMDTDFCLVANDLPGVSLQRQTVHPRLVREYTAELPARILEALCEARDLFTAISFTLQFVGKQYNVSRVYVFEKALDGVAFNNTHEWCAEGISPQKERLQNIPLEKNFRYSSLFSEDGIFYCPDTSKLETSLTHFFEQQGICSTLQCSFREENCFKGFIGFDECNEKRLWTKPEVDSLALIAKILGLFILKMRTYERLKKTLSMFQSVINNQTLWVYVVDPKTYEILFLNQKTKDNSSAVEGSLCYQVLRNKTAPCSDCPMLELSLKNPICSREIHNIQMGIELDITASLMSWQEPEHVVLMCCFDITKYKGTSGLPASEENTVDTPRDA
ncbi:MAG: PAS domain-containing protein [Bilophila sp.]